MSVTVNFDISKILNKKLGVNQVKVKKFIANEFVTVTDPLVPFREGFLKNSATIAVDGSFVEYNMPYAKRLYYNPQYKFKGAPIRGGLWAERSMAINGKAIINSLQKAVDEGEL